jgi:hypothetical protein
MLVLGHLSIKLWVLITFAYGAQTRQTFMRWNPLSIAHEKSIQHPSINLIVIHTLRTRIFYLMMWTFGWSSETCTNMLGCLLGGGSSQEKFMKVGVEESNMLPSPNAIGGGGCEGPGCLECGREDEWPACWRPFHWPSLKVKLPSSPVSGAMSAEIFGHGRSRSSDCFQVQPVPWMTSFSFSLYQFKADSLTAL